MGAPPPPPLGFFGFGGVGGLVVRGGFVRAAGFPVDPPERTVGVRCPEVPVLRLAPPVVRTVGAERVVPPVLRTVGEDRVAPPLLLTTPEDRLDPLLVRTVGELRVAVPVPRVVGALLTVAPPLPVVGGLLVAVPPVVPPPLPGLRTLEEGRDAGFLVGWVVPDEVAEEPGRVGRRSRTGLPVVPEVPADPGFARAVEGTVEPDPAEPDRRVAVPSTPGLDCPVTPGGLPPTVPGLKAEGDPERGTALRCWVPSTPGRLTGGVVRTTT